MSLSRACLFQNMLVEPHTRLHDCVFAELIAKRSQLQSTSSRSCDRFIASASRNSRVSLTFWVTLNGRTASIYRVLVKEIRWEAVFPNDDVSIPMIGPKFPPLT